MRRKTTRRNYGKYYEVFFVCNEQKLPFCRGVAEGLTRGYGILAGAMDYATFEQADEATKKALRTSYHVVFMLSDQVIEESLKEEGHPFLKVYAYVHRKNRFSISCATLDGYVVSETGPFPSFMGDFNNLHRKPFSTCEMGRTVEELAKEIRLYYSNSRKMALHLAHNHGASGFGTYYTYMDDKSRWCLRLSVAMLLFFCVFNYLLPLFDALVFYSLLFAAAYWACYILRARIGMHKRCALVEDFDRFYAADYSHLSSSQRRLMGKLTSIKRRGWFKAALYILGWFVLISISLGFGEKDPVILSAGRCALFLHTFWLLTVALGYRLEAKLGLEALSHRGVAVRVNPVAKKLLLDVSGCGKVLW